MSSGAPADGDIEIDDIEILGVATTTEDASTVETVSAGGDRRNALAVLAALTVAALGVAGLTSGSEETTAPTTTSSTQPSTTTTPSSTTTLPDRIVAEIGDGPTLVWDRVAFEVNAVDFTWVEDGFLGADGTTDYRVRPNGTLTVSTNGLAEGQPIIQSSSIVTGDGTANPSLLRFSTLGGDEVGLEPMVIPESDLVDSRLDLAVERNGDQVLVLQTVGGVLDVPGFRARTGVEIEPIFDVVVSPTVLTVSGEDDQEVLPIGELDLSPGDLEALRTLTDPIIRLSAGTIGGTTEAVEVDIARVEWIAVAGDDFVAGGTELRRSSNGIDWEGTSADTPMFGGLLPPGPDGSLVGLSFELDETFLTVSTDAARNWADIPSPLSNIWQTSSVAPVAAITGWRDDAFLPAVERWSVLTPAFELLIGSVDNSFELSTRDGELLLSGRVDQLDSGFQFAPGSNDIWFVDPETNEEIARFPQALFASAFAAQRTSDGNPQLVAFADVSQPERPVWSLTPVNELFGPDALSVSFVPGDGWFLANVVTSTGRELYLAEVPEELAAPSSGRHPTHGEITASQDSDGAPTD